MSSMQIWLVQQIMAALIIKLDADTIKRAADAMIDAVEDAVENTETELDDAVVIPLLDALRAAFNVPDND